MNAIKLFCIFMLFSVGAATAAPAPSPFVRAGMRAFSKNTNIQKDPLYYRFILQDTPRLSATFRNEKSWGSSVYSFFFEEGRDKKRQIQTRRIAGYLYNMYIDSFLKGSLPSGGLDLNYIGVLDPLIAAKPAALGDFVSYYNTNKEEIKQEVSALFARHIQMRAQYDPNDERNTAMELWFFEILSKGVLKEETVGYMGAFMPSSSARIALQKLEQLMQKSIQSNASEIATYKEADTWAALDSKNRIHEKNYYRPVSEECAACTYTFCKRVCTGLKEYGDWNVLRLYTVVVSALPRGRVSFATGKAFLNKEGKPHPAWNYHRAALIAVHQKGETGLFVVDPFFSDKPLPLGEWAQLFDWKKNGFFLVPFERSPGVEESIRTVPADQIQKMQRGYRIQLNGTKYDAYK